MTNKLRLSSRSTSAPVKRGGWKRHLEGWQPGLVAVTIAGFAALLVVQRPVEPADLPVPMADARLLHHIAETDDARARTLGLPPQCGKAAAAAAHELDSDVRALGTAIRAFGLVDAQQGGTTTEVLAVKKQVADATGPALQQGPEAVLSLRAWQQLAFLCEIDRWQRTGDETTELQELAGNFIGLLDRNGWVTQQGNHRRVLLDKTTQRVLFKKRWNAIVGLQGSVFALTLDEERVLYRFLLMHPVQESTSVTDSKHLVSSHVDNALERHDKGQYRLKKIDELASLDTSYPADLARGVVLYQLGQYMPAAGAFRRHLEAFPDGPYTLRAQNYLVAALNQGLGGL